MMVQNSPLTIAPPPAPAPAHLAQQTLAVAVLQVLMSLEGEAVLQAGSQALDGWAGAAPFPEDIPLGAGAGAAALPEMSLLGRTGGAAALGDIRALDGWAGAACFPEGTQPGAGAGAAAAALPEDSMPST